MRFENDTKKIESFVNKKFIGSSLVTLECNSHDSGYHKHV